MHGVSVLLAGVAIIAGLGAVAVAISILIEVARFRRGFRGEGE